jgi:hypothetical protein
MKIKHVQANMCIIPMDFSLPPLAQMIWPTTADSMLNSSFFGLNIKTLCRKRTHIFRVIGQFLAKAMLDSRIIDLSFNKIFLKLILGDEVPLTLATLKVR